jgi:hypothetical protein
MLHKVSVAGLDYNVPDRHQFGMMNFKVRVAGTAPNMQLEYLLKLKWVKLKYLQVHIALHLCVLAGAELTGTRRGILNTVAQTSTDSYFIQSTNANGIYKNTVLLFADVVQALIKLGMIYACICHSH